MKRFIKELTPSSRNSRRTYRRVPVWRHSLGKCLTCFGRRSFYKNGCRFASVRRTVCNRLHFLQHYALLRRQVVGLVADQKHYASLHRGVALAADDRHCSWLHRAVVLVADHTNWVTEHRVVALAADRKQDYYKYLRRSLCCLRLCQTSGTRRSRLRPTQQRQRSLLRLFLSRRTSYPYWV